jgi:ribosomal protein S18 acetylase RimI-like enzyme
MRPRQRIVAAVSIVIAVISSGLYLFYRIQFHATPLWDKVTLAYGGVFCLFLFFDSAAKSVADSRDQRRDAAVERPRPKPSARPGQSVVAAPAPTTAGTVTVGIVRVQNDWEPFLNRVNAFTHELSALEGKKPALDVTSGRAKLAEETLWRTLPGSNPFGIMVDDEVVGCCAVEVGTAGEASLLVMYVDPARRRQRIGQSAMRHLCDFLRLTGAQSLEVTVSTQNHRGERFLTQCGFRSTGGRIRTPEDEAISRRLWALPLAEENKL